MKLKEVLLLSNLNERSRFYAILSNIISQSDDTCQLSGKEDIEGFVKALVSPRIKEELSKQFARSLRDDYYLDIAADILIQDGKCILHRDQLAYLYKEKMTEVGKSRDAFKNTLNDEKDENDLDVDENRLRDYRIYADCVNVAYSNNEEEYNQNKNTANISNEERSVLSCLANGLGLSHSEARGLYLSQIPDFTEEKSIDEVISSIVSAGVGIYIKKQLTLYIPEEIIEILRDIRGIRIERKYLRRILVNLPSKTLSNILRRHQIKPSRDSDKLNLVLDSGLDVEEILKVDIYPENCSESSKKKMFVEFVTNSLGLPDDAVSGRTMNEKIESFIGYIRQDENERKDTISVDGYDQLISKLGPARVKIAFEILGLDFQDPEKISAKQLLDYDILPKDILYTFSDEVLWQICTDMDVQFYKNMNVMTLVSKILANLNDSENIFIEHYEELANNDSVALARVGLTAPNGNFGLKFQTTTQTIFEKLNLSVRQLKNPSDRNEYADIILDFGEAGIVIVECKSSKRDYSKFTSVSRQVASYARDYMKEHTVLGVLIVSNSFTQDFIDSAEKVSDFDLYLITAHDLKKIYDELKKTTKFKINYRNLLKNTVVKPDLVISGAKIN